VVCCGASARCAPRHLHNPQLNRNKLSLQHTNTLQHTSTQCNTLHHVRCEKNNSSHNHCCSHILSLLCAPTFPLIASMYTYLYERQIQKINDTQPRAHSVCLSVFLSRANTRTRSLCHLRRQQKIDATRARVRALSLARALSLSLNSSFSLTLFLTHTHARAAKD